MSATEELRRLLDERRVEYETDDRNGLRETIWCGTAAFQLSPTAKMTMIVTPKQAIAATLSGDDKSRWHELFGTPERAARTLTAIGGRYPCDEGAQNCDACPLNGAPCRLNRCNPEESKLLEWLRGDAE